MGKEKKGALLKVYVWNSQTHLILKGVILGSQASMPRLKKKKVFSSRETGKLQENVWHILSWRGTTDHESFISSNWSQLGQIGKISKVCSCSRVPLKFNWLVLMCELKNCLQWETRFTRKTDITINGRKLTLTRVFPERFETPWKWNKHIPIIVPR